MLYEVITRSYQGATVESVEFEDGMRRLERAVVAFQRSDGRGDRFAMEVVSRPLYMQGGGYWGGFDDGLGRGIYRGEDHVEGEVAAGVVRVEGKSLLADAQRPFHGLGSHVPG